MKAEYKLVNLFKDNSDIDCSNCPITIICITTNALRNAELYKRMPINLLNNAINYDKSIIDIDTDEDLNYLKDLSNRCYNSNDVTIDRKESIAKYRLNRTTDDTCCDTCALVILCRKYHQFNRDHTNKANVVNIEKFAKFYDVDINDILLINECIKSSVNINIVENKD